MSFNLITNIPSGTFSGLTSLIILFIITTAYYLQTLSTSVHKKLELYWRNHAIFYFAPYSLGVDFKCIPFQQDIAWYTVANWLLSWCFICLNYTSFNMQFTVTSPPIHLWEFHQIYSRQSHYQHCLSPCSVELPISNDNLYDHFDHLNQLLESSKACKRINIKLRNFHTTRVITHKKL